MLGCNDVMAAALERVGIGQPASRQGRGHDPQAVEHRPDRHLELGDAPIDVRRRDRPGDVGAHRTIPSAHGCTMVREALHGADTRCTRERSPASWARCAATGRSAGCAARPGLAGARRPRPRRPPRRRSSAGRRRRRPDRAELPVGVHNSSPASACKRTSARVSRSDCDASASSIPNRPLARTRSVTCSAPARASANVRRRTASTSDARAAASRAAAPATAVHSSERSRSSTTLSSCSRARIRSVGARSGPRRTTRRGGPGGSPPDPGAAAWRARPAASRSTRRAGRRARSRPGAVRPRRTARRGWRRRAAGRRSRPGRWPRPGPGGGRPGGGRQRAREHRHVRRDVTAAVRAGAPRPSGVGVSSCVHACRLTAKPVES